MKCESILVGIVDNIQELVLVFNFKVGTLPTTYLGLPLHASNKDLVVRNLVIDRNQKRLVGL